MLRLAGLMYLAGQPRYHLGWALERCLAIERRSEVNYIPLADSLSSSRASDGPIRAINVIIFDKSLRSEGQHAKNLGVMHRRRSRIIHAPAPYGVSLLKTEHLESNYSADVADQICVAISGLPFSGVVYALLTTFFSCAREINRYRWWSL